MQWITTTQVLADLQKSPESTAWKKFLDIFYPLLVNFAKRFGLNDTDAEDAAQETILAFIKSFQRGAFCRQKGHLSQWLFGIAKNTIRHFLSRLPRERLVPANTQQTAYWDQIASQDPMESVWQDEWQQMVLTRCVARVRQEFDGTLFKAFEEYAVFQKPIEEVCRQLSMTPNAVYIAKSRILARLRELQKEFEGLDEWI